MTQSAKDAAIEVIKVGRDGIRFRFGAELHIPQQLRPLAHVSPRPPAAALPTQYDQFRITAASPPPTRDGQPWEWGLLVAHPGADDSPPSFDPTSSDTAVSGQWRRYGIDWVEGIPSLDRPLRETVILDQALAVPFEWGQEMTFAAEPDSLAFSSVPYPQPYQYDAALTSVGVNFYGEYTLPWCRVLSPGDWVAISFDQFQPPNRDSADVITQVQDCNLFHPPFWRPAE